MFNHLARRARPRPIYRARKPRAPIGRRLRRRRESPRRLRPNVRTQATIGQGRRPSASRFPISSARARRRGSNRCPAPSPPAATRRALFRALSRRALNRRARRRALNRRVRPRGSKPLVRRRASSRRVRRRALNRHAPRHAWKLPGPRRASNHRGLRRAWKRRGPRRAPNRRELNPPRAMSSVTNRRESNPHRATMRRAMSRRASVPFPSGLSRSAASPSDVERPKVVPKVARAVRRKTRID
jgi:hypothetical protein